MSLLVQFSGLRHPSSTAISTPRPSGDPALSPVIAFAPGHDAPRAHFSLHDPVSGSRRRSPLTSSCLRSPKTYPLPLTPTASFCKSRRVHKLDSTLRMRRAPSRRFDPKYPRVAS